MAAKGGRAPSAPGPAAWAMQALLGSGRLLPRASRRHRRTAPRGLRPTPGLAGTSRCRWERGLVVQPTCLAPCTSLLPLCGWGPSFHWWERGSDEALVIKIQGRKGLWRQIISLLSLIHMILKSSQVAGCGLLLGCEMQPRGLQTAAEQSEPTVSGVNTHWRRVSVSSGRISGCLKAKGKFQRWRVPKGLC